MREETERPTAHEVVDLSGSGSLPRPRVAVVLAAGRSTRLREVTGGGSKALVRLGGLALVERAVRTLVAEGFQRVIVVVGFHAGPVAAVASRAAPGRVQIVVAEGWEAGNGASLAAAREALEGELSFLVVTADHVFAEGALDALARAGEQAVLVDPAAGAEVLAEATRVEVDHTGRVLRMGKGVEAPLADCGAFLLGPSVFPAAANAAAAGDPSLAATVETLARAETVRAVPLRDGDWWHDVDTPADLVQARRLIRRSLRRPTDGPVSRFLNRTLSVPISLALAPFRPSPDLLSVLALVVGLGGAVLLGLGHGLAGGLLVQACSVLDGVDGEVARLGVRAGQRGALLDGFMDRLGDAAIAAGLAVWAVRTDVRPVAGVLLAVAATAGAILSMATKDRVAALGLESPSERRLGWLLGGRDGRLATVAVLSILGLPAAALGATAATALIAAALRVAFARHPPA